MLGAHALHNLYPIALPLDKDKRDITNIISSSSQMKMNCQQSRTAPSFPRDAFNGRHVRIGSKVPDFTLASADGREVKLSDFRGSKVMVCFYRFSPSTVDAYTINKLMGEYKKLAWASKLKVVVVFHHRRQSLVQLTDENNSPNPRLTGNQCYPFVALADPDGSAAAKFQVKRKGFVKQLTSKYAPRIFSRDAVSSAHSRNSSLNVLPSEFLIDEDGILVDVMRAKKSSEHMSLDQVGSFLVHGRRCPTVLLQNKYGQLAKERSRYTGETWVIDENED